MKIAIASGKGGTGKTTLSTNLADFTSKKKLYKEIVLADLDVEEPNSGLFIKAVTEDELVRNKMIPEWDSSRCTNCGLCDEVCNFNALLSLGDTVIVMPELCHSCYACSELCPSGAMPMKARRMGRQKLSKADGFDFIESRLDIGQEQAVPLIAQSIDYIDEHYHDDALVIIDSPPGSSCPVIEAAKKSDFVILVTEPTPFGLHDLGLAVNTMREIGREFAVVINRYGIGNDDVVDYCTENGIDIIAKLPDSRRIAELYSSGNLVYPEVPEFASGLNRISDYIHNIHLGGNS